MINNNPYNIPEKPLRQSKVIVQTMPLYPHQANRRVEEIESKMNPHFLKRSSIGYCYENVTVEPMRMPLNPPQQIKSNNPPMISFVENVKESHQDRLIRELTERILFITNKLETHDLRINALLEARKLQQSQANLYQSTMLNSQNSNIFSSHQFDKNSIILPEIQTKCQADIIENINQIKQQLHALVINKHDSENYLRTALTTQKQVIQNELKTHLKDYVKYKFEEEQKKIAKYIDQTHNEMKNTLQQDFRSIHWQIQRVKEELHKSNIKQEKSSHFTTNIDQKINQISKILSDFQEENHQFKSELEREVKQHMNDELHNVHVIIFNMNQQIQKIEVDEKQQKNKLTNLRISKARNEKATFKLSYEEYYKVCKESNQTMEMREIKLFERVYYIDQDGCLLDENRYYLVDENDQNVKISEENVQKLKKQGIFY